MLSLATYSQKDSELYKFMMHLNETYPEGVSTTILDDSHESYSWYYIYRSGANTLDDQILMLQLRDSIEQVLNDNANRASSFYHTQKSNGTSDTIRYTLQMNASDNAIQAEKVNESFSLNYLPGKEYSELCINYFREWKTPMTDELVPCQPVKAILDDIAATYAIEQHRVKYAYNTSIDTLDNDGSLIGYGIDSLGHNVRHCSGSNPNVKEGSCSGNMYVFPHDKFDSILDEIAHQLFSFLQTQRDRKFDYLFTKPTRYQIGLYGVGKQLDIMSAHSQIFKRPLLPKSDNGLQGIWFIRVRPDKYGNLVVLLIDDIQQTAALPLHYEHIIAYDHGRKKLRVEGDPHTEYHFETPDAARFSIRFPSNHRMEYTGFFDVNIVRQQLQGGSDLWNTIYGETTMSEDSVALIRNKLTSHFAGNIQHTEKHTAEYDSLLMTVYKPDGWLRLVFQFGRDPRTTDRYHLDTKVIMKEMPSTKEHPNIPEIPNMSWLDSIIDSLQQRGDTRMYPITYEYGQKGKPETTGTVGGRLYVVQSASEEDYEAKQHFIGRQYSTYLTRHHNQTFDIIDDYRLQTTRFSDYRLVRYDDKARQIQFLFVDDVEGKYMIPEEWYHIVSYKYGKKKYVKK